MKVNSAAPAPLRPLRPTAPETTHDCGGRQPQHGAVDPNAAAPKYFRSYDQVRQAMQDLQAKYPDLVQIEDIGDSFEKVKSGGQTGRDVLAMRLTNSKTGGDKPSALWIGGVHAREIANPEMLMRWASETLAKHGTDPAATALLDTREINIVPIVNPDGHAVVERGYAKQPAGNLMHRKSTSDPFGVDLNRNFDFKWGGNGSSDNPRSDIYRGVAAASEPEVQAVQQFAERIKPDIAIDWHSYSELVLYPWGYTRDKAPDNDGLSAVAKRFASMNGYKPQQSIDLYPTTGTSKDWFYGKLGVPAFTLETGRTFHQSDAEFERNYAANAPVMTYAAQIADSPYERAKAPTLQAGATEGALTAVATGAGHVVAKVEAFTDPATPVGKGVRLAPVDGAYDSGSETVALPTELARQGAIYVRACDIDGRWGPAVPQPAGR